MELYSGQGRVSLAKRGPDGKVDRKSWFFVGNVPDFTVNFRTGEINMSVEELKDEVLEIVCGSAVRTSRQLIPADHHIDCDVNADVAEFDIGDGAPFEYELSFEGVNTAMTSTIKKEPSDLKAFPRWRVYLHRVTFTPAEKWPLISDDIASIQVSATAHKDELKNNKRGTVQRIHKESFSGLRSKDLQLDGVTV